MFDIILGENTKEAAPGCAMIEIDLIRVKGRTQPARIYALLGDEAHAVSDGFARLADTNEKFLAAYRRRDWRRACGLLNSCRTLGGPRLAALYEMFAGRIDGFANTPPPKDWTGVYEAERK